MDCLFCKIANGEIHSEIVYEDDKFIAFQDISPQAPVHVLLVPKEHIESTDTIKPEHQELIGWIFVKIPEIIKDMGLGNGYRVVTNTGMHGGQSVPHLHFHIIGGRELAWPPG